MSGSVENSKRAGKGRRGVAVGRVTWSGLETGAVAGIEFGTLVSEPSRAALANALSA